MKHNDGSALALARVKTVYEQPKEDEIPETFRCWCGDEGAYEEMFQDEYLEDRCGGSRTLHCRCGGDMCVCHNHGETECSGCPDCDDDDGDEWDNDDWSALDFDGGDDSEVKTWWPPTVTAPTITDAMLEADDPSTECHCHD